MATIKSYSDLQQSKKLAEILPLESADMTYYACVKDWHGNPVEPKWGKPANLTKEELALPCSNFQEYEYVPCWSLSALLGVLPDEITDDGDVYRNMFFHLKDKYIIQYPRLTTLWPSLLSVEADNPIDACVTMIEKLNELKML